MLKASGVGAAGLALRAAASPVAAQEEDDEEAPVNDVEDLRIPFLNLDTLEAELDGEPLQAESYAEWQWRQGSSTYVGEVAGRPGLFVAVSHLEGNDEQPDEIDEVNEDEEVDEEDEQPADVVVYLCDGEPGVPRQRGGGLYLSGEFDEGGMTLTDEEGEVKLALVDGEFLGVVIPPGDEEPFPFVASEATGDAGLYRAVSGEHTDNDEPLVIRWVVLADDRQRGSTCVGVRVRSVCVGVSW